MPNNFWGKREKALGGIYNPYKAWANYKIWNYLFEFVGVGIIYFSVNMRNFWF